MFWPSLYFTSLLHTQRGCPNSNSQFVLNIVIRIIILVNNHLDPQFSFLVCLFQFYTCFEKPYTHHQESHFYQYDIRYMSLCVGDRLVCGYGWIYIHTCIPDCHLCIVTCTRCLIDTIDSWWWAHGCSKHVENWNKHINKNNCASSWLFTRIVPRCTVSKT